MHAIVFSLIRVIIRYKTTTTSLMDNTTKDEIQKEKEKAAWIAMDKSDKRKSQNRNSASNTQAKESDSFNKALAIASTALSTVCLLMISISYCVDFIEKTQDKINAVNNTVLELSKENAELQQAYLLATDKYFVSSTQTEKSKTALKDNSNNSESAVVKNKVSQSKDLVSVQKLLANSNLTQAEAQAEAQAVLSAYGLETIPVENIHNNLIRAEPESATSESEVEITNLLPHNNTLAQRLIFAACSSGLLILFILICRAEDEKQK